MKTAGTQPEVLQEAFLVRHSFKNRLMEALMVTQTCLFMYQV